MPLHALTCDDVRFADHFPDAFYGQNNKIRETLNNLILKSPQEWQTAVALPFVRIQGTVRYSATSNFPDPYTHTQARSNDVVGYEGTVAVALFGCD